MMIQCPECKQEISDQAKTCPHCGYPIKPRFAGIKAVGWVLLALLVWFTAESLFGNLSSFVIIPFFANVFNLESTAGTVICFIVIFGITSFVVWWITLIASIVFTRTRGQAIACGVIVVVVCIVSLIINPKTPYTWGALIASLGWFLTSFRDSSKDFIPSKAVILIVVFSCIAIYILEIFAGYKMQEKYIQESAVAYEAEVVSQIEDEISRNDINYIVNLSTKIFHKPECSYAPKPTSESFYLSHEPYGKLIKEYSPCEYCL